MHISLEELNGQLRKHIVAHETLCRQVQEVVGSIKVIQRLIAKISQPTEPVAPEPEPKPDFLDPEMGELTPTQEQ